MEVEPMMLNETMNAALACITCGRQYPRDEVRYRCDCGETLEVALRPPILSRQTVTPARFDARLACPAGRVRQRRLALPRLLPAFADERDRQQARRATPTSTPLARRRAAGPVAGWARMPAWTRST